MKTAEQRILEHMLQIRDIIMDICPGAPYTSLTIHDNGMIAFNNAYWELPEDLRIKYTEGLEDDDDC